MDLFNVSYSNATMNATQSYYHQWQVLAANSLAIERFLSSWILYLLAHPFSLASLILTLLGFYSKRLTFYYWFCVVYDLLWLYFPGLMRRYFSRWLDRFIYRFDADCMSTIRTEFHSMSLPKARKSNTNAHAEAAAQRTVADEFISGLARILGMFEFSHYMGTKDQYRDIQGTRLYHNEKDLKLRFRWDTPSAKNLTKLIDVDYFLEEFEFYDYLTFGRPLLMYTYHLTDLVRMTPEISSWFDKDNIFHSVVSGGGMYQHKLWNWTRDVITIRSVTRLWFVTCYVEIRPMPNDRAIVMLLPQLKGGPIASVLMYLMGIYARAIDWYNPATSDGNQTLMRGDTVTLARTGLYSSAQMTQAKYAELACLYSQNSSAFDSSILQITKDQVHIKMIKTYFKNLSSTVPIIPAYGEVTGGYNVIYSDLPVDGSTVNRAVFNPIFNGGFTPVKSVSNTVATVKNRVIDTNPAVTHSYTVPRKFRRYLSEFVAEMRVRLGEVHPFTMEEIVDNANPKKKTLYESFASQCVGLYDAAIAWKHRGYRHVDRDVETGVEMETISVHSGYEGDLEPPGTTEYEDLRTHKTSAFQKAETHTNIKYPRNITAVDSAHVLTWLTFWQAISKACVAKDIKWYAFGLNPDQLQERVTEVFPRSCDLVETDFSKFDGTQGLFAREVELQLMYALFDEKYHDQILALSSAQNWLTIKARTIDETSVYYTTSNQRLSGSGDTSGGNTCLNAFYNYSVNREAGMDHNTAWSSLGVYGGDDGISRYLDEKIYEKVAKIMHFSLKVEVRKAGEDCSFLGRRYPDITGSGMSYYDPIRQIDRMHQAINVEGQNLVKVAANKAVSWFVTEVGVLADIAEKIIERAKAEGVRDYDLQKYYTRLSNVPEEVLPSRGTLQSILDNYRNIEDKVYDSNEDIANLTYLRVAEHYGISVQELKDHITLEWEPFGTSVSPFETIEPELPKDKDGNVDAVEIISNNDGQLLGEPKPAEVKQTPQSNINMKSPKPICWFAIKPRGCANKGCGCEHKVPDDACWSYIRTKPKRPDQTDCGRKGCKYKHGFEVQKNLITRQTGSAKNQPVSHFTKPIQTSPKLKPKQNAAKNSAIESASKEASQKQRVQGPSKVNRKQPTSFGKPVQQQQPVRSLSRDAPKSGRQ